MCEEKRLCEEETKRQRDKEEKGGCRERRENVSLGVGDKNKGGYERRCQPFILRLELITMNCF